ncbi:MAG: tetratricopeptide repeat protein [Asticcacaulis sp.]
MAQYNLGWMYLEGDGIPQNRARGVQFIQKAADQGDAEAQYDLGVMYLKGYGVLQDRAMAVQLIQKAADQGVRSGASRP